VKRKEFIENMRQRLIEQRTRILSNETLLEGLSVRSEPGDTVDQATDSVNGEINAQLADAEYREVSKIDKALRQVAEGCYGVCEGCRKNIPVKRLEAIPHASFCIDCKRLAEEHDIEGESPDWAAIHGFDMTSTDSDATVS
jgi:DnaK suppressor protein